LRFVAIVGWVLLAVGLAGLVFCAGMSSCSRSFATPEIVKAFAFALAVGIVLTASRRVVREHVSGKMAALGLGALIAVGLAASGMIWFTAEHHGGYFAILRASPDGMGFEKLAALIFASAAAVSIAVLVVLRGKEKEESRR
jgi:uncharacterized membrane protein